MHNSCYASLSSNTKFLQVEKCKQNSEESLQDKVEVSDHSNDPVLQASAPKKLCSNTGPLYDKTHCIWCMKGAYLKSSDHDKQLILLSTLEAWNKFKLHIVYLEDQAMRERLDTLIDSIPDAQTAFGIKICYHHICWPKYLSNYKPLTDETAQHLQRVNL